MTKQQINAPLNYVPADILCAQDYEILAQHFITDSVYAYIAGGSGQDVTARANTKAFDSYALIPRVLRDVSQGHTSTQFLNSELQHPILLAPVAFQKLVHPLGELETARAADATGSCLVTSSLSTTSLEDVARHSGSRRWFQLYFQPDRKQTLALLRRAEAAGYEAIVVTLDASVQMPSLRARRSGFQMPENMVSANISSPQAAVNYSVKKGQSRIFQGHMQQAPTFQDLDWLQDQTELPILAKGVLHVDDAVALKSMGMDGIIVSNHGGRNLDGAPSSLQMLPSIRQATGDSFTLLLDSGIRSGQDIFKALALGADAVMVGRLQVYALSVAGALGVGHMLKLLREELELCMALCGCSCIEDISKANLTTFD